MAETTGTTENHVPPTQYIHISDIYDESYDEELRQYIFDFYTYAGDHISLRLKKKDIERFNLFMRKADAEQKWIDHIIKQ
jgi:hypothetical protein